VELIGDGLRMVTDKVILLGCVIGSFYVVLMVVLFAMNYVSNRITIRAENDRELNMRRFALAQETGILLTLEEAREIAIAEEYYFYIR
jgi:hypothetical protein